MIKNILIFFIINICLGSLTAQTFVKRYYPFQSSRPIKAAAIDTLKILAVMADFQVDEDETTVGNGKFGSIYSKDYGNNILDPLPHDKSYFEAHLEFVKNYFEKVSNGKLVVKYYVLPGIITLSQQMRNYSTLSNSTDFSPLANFSQEVWKKADSANQGFDFGSYNLFTIFHAGVGRDVSIPGSIGDSRDLPSIFLSLNALRNIYGNSFNGYPVQNNSFNITNSSILPETESREQTLIDGSVALTQITINGLLANNVGNFLGLPDLFNTTNGTSAIGRFGLMDGQATFAYNGVFPPEPSAWEKIYLGWAAPITLSPVNNNINLITHLAASLTDTAILKVPINSSEYFLIENRERDANNDGAKITYVLNGNTFTQTFPKDLDNFVSYDTDTLSGVITDVDEYDWALPGLLNDTAHYGGGILIWHIDDNIINANIASDQINADPVHRGVNLMEASGIPEIGQTFTDILGDTFIGEGTYEDYWYSSNPAVLYRNRFADDSRPSSQSNSGANSLIALSNFSNSGNRMSFKITFGDSLVKPIFTTKIQPVSGNNKLTVSQNNSSANFNLISNSDVIALDDKGAILQTLNGFSKLKTASITLNNTQYLVGARDSVLNVYMSNGASGYSGSIKINDLITAAPVITNENSANEILIGSGNGYIRKYALGALPNINPTLIAVDTSNVGLTIKQIASTDNYYSFVSTGISTTVSNSQQNGKYYLVLSDNQKNRFLRGTNEFYQLAVSVNQSGNKINILLLSGNIFDIVSGGKITNEFQINSSDSIKSFALADLKQDGNNYIIFSNGKQIDAVNMQGAEAGNFPFIDPQGIGFTGTPVTADFSGDAKSEIIASTTDGRIFALDGGTGKVVDGFPISTGAQLAATPVLFNYQGKLSLAAVNQQGNFSAWTIGANDGKVFWAEENGNSQNTGFIGTASNQNISNTFFPSNRTYNYPNPVYGGDTRIHYYVSEDSKIDIKIFDIAGDYVAHLIDNAQGGFEKETPWNVNKIRSGIYFASIKATGASGKVETNIIKIAVIK